MTKVTVGHVAGYVRVSLSEMAENGHSLASQRARIEGYCAGNGLTLDAIYEDRGASGKSLDREGLQAALGAVKRGAGLVVAKMDRLSRDIVGQTELINRWFRAGKRALYCVDAPINVRTAQGRSMAQLYAVFASAERELLAERTSQAMQQMRSDGLYTGGRPRFGYAIGEDGALVENPHEQEILRAIRAARTAGHTLRAIVAALDERGVRSRVGKPFALAQVARMLAA
jgi:DNA invertase Pin-like site-specific DNA recombinase